MITYGQNYWILELTSHISEMERYYSDNRKNIQSNILLDFSSGRIYFHWTNCALAEVWDIGSFQVSWSDLSNISLW